MTLLQYFKPTVLILSILIGTSLPADIVIRHDKNDSDYIKLGAEFPAVGKVGERAGDGTLIGQDWVLTAGHVASGMQRRYGNNFKVYFEGYPQGIAVEAVYVHPEFRPMQGHDIGLLKLKQSISNITPLKFYTNSDEAGKPIMIVGHGDFKNGNETEWTVDGKKRAATNRIESVNDNHIIYHFDKPGTEGVTKLEGTAGRGDSGGPALIQVEDQWLVAGVSSAGMPGENGPGTYGAVEHYTRVSTHSNWLNDVLNGKVQPSQVSNQARNQGGARRVRGGQGSPALPGLGLILNHREGKIYIEGKIDPQVPSEFRRVVFGPPSFIVSLDGQEYKNLDKFKEAFGAIKKGASYEITFSVKGETKSFKSTKE